MAERDIGGFIRDMRRNAKVSLRQLADQAGVSNPYLSQIERGLRKPSAEVLQQLANALKVSTPLMYLRAGLLNQKDGPSTLAAIASDTGLTTRQKQTITEIYESFRRENIRDEGIDLPDDTEEPVVTDADVAAMAEDLAEDLDAEDSEFPDTEESRDDDKPAVKETPPPATSQTPPRASRARNRNRTAASRPTKTDSAEQ